MHQPDKHAAKKSMTPPPLVVFPNATLRQLSAPIVDFTRAAELASMLKETMRQYDGAGIAAIQVGVPEQIFVLDQQAATEDGKPQPTVYVNPEIEPVGTAFIAMTEGCLSFPLIFTEVRRPKKVRVKAVDENGKSFEVTASGFFARALQHEHDHLIGKLMIDHVGPVKKDIIKRKMRSSRRE